MSIRLIPTRGESPPPYSEDVIWQLSKRAATTGALRRAHAVTRTMDHGYELRVFVDGDLVLSHLFRDAEVNALQAKSAKYRADFEGLGWTIDTKPEAPSSA